MDTDEQQRRHEARYQRACDEAGAAAFRHPGDEMDAPPGPVAPAADVMAQLAVVLSPLFGFIAKGHLGGTLDMRAWCVLYCLRAEYVRGETIAEYARRRGVSPKRVQVLINELRAELPALRSPHAKSAAHVAAMRLAHAPRGAAVGPVGGGAGKESFAGPPERLAGPRAAR